MPKTVFVHALTDENGIPTFFAGVTRALALKGVRKHISEDWAEREYLLGKMEDTPIQERWDHYFADWTGNKYEWDEVTVTQEAEVVDGKSNADLEN